MAEDTLLAIDQGTTSSRAILFSRGGKILHVAQKELPQHFPQKGWVEHDPEDIWADTLWACRKVLNTAEGAACKSIGITNQRETALAWNKETGRCVYKAIVWQDRRTASFCDTLKADAQIVDLISKKTGLLPDPYFSASKIKWILDHVDGAKDLAEKGKLAFGTVDSFLLWRLTDGRVHATDTTNAARTGLFNIITQDWDNELLALYGINRAILPQVHDNVHDFGETASHIFERSLPVTGMAGDQHAALVGQVCFDRGMMKSTYGTGCFALMNIGHDFKVSKNKLLTTPAYRIGGKTTYAVEGSIFIAGAAIQWLRDNMGVIRDAAESESLAMSVADSNGVYFIPAFSGLGAPHWDPAARAAIFGMTRETTKAHIVRAALEAQAYQTRDLLAAMQLDTGVYPDILRCDGGLVANKFMCSFLSDILQARIDVPEVTETTALGAAFLAGLGAGLYSSLDDLRGIWGVARHYEPAMTKSLAQDSYRGWCDVLSRIYL